MWIQIIIQVVEAILQGLISHPPAQVSDTHEADLAKLKKALEVLKS